jgi:ribosome-associated protein
MVTPKARKTAAAPAKSRASKTASKAASPAAKAAAKPSKARTPKLPKSVVGAVEAARDRKALDVVVLDLRKAGGFTDYFVICTGTNPRQVNAIADAVEEELRTDFGERPTLAEGVKKSEWILLDYFNFVVHVFSRDCREFYGLERLWGNAERIEFANEP